MSEPPFSAPVEPGQMLAGKYRVERVLGMGGMGVVVAAIHVDLDERRAVKFMLPQALADANAVERFLREARAAVRLKGEHVAKVHDVGRLDSGAPYIVMEYLQGSDLLALLQHGGAMPVSRAASYVLQACEAIAEAHAAGIIHRDLKPANLFLATGPDGAPTIKVLDFGISKLLDSEPSRDGGDLTNTTAMIGSPSYMSPEQIRSTKLVDARTDIWSLGVILYQLVTGQLPFNADSRLALCMSVVQDPAPPPSQRLAGLPTAVDALVMRCLEKHPDARFRTVADLAAALAPLCPGPATELSVERIRRMLGQPSIAPPAAATPSAATPAPVLALGQRTDASWGNTAARERPRRRLLLGVAAVAVLALGGGLTIALRAGGPPAAGSATDATPAAELPAPAVPPVSQSASAAQAPAAPEVAPEPTAGATASSAAPSAAPKAAAPQPRVAAPPPHATAKASAAPPPKTAAPASTPPDVFGTGRK